MCVMPNTGTDLKEAIVESGELKTLTAQTGRRCNDMKANEMNDGKKAKVFGE